MTLRDWFREFLDSMPPVFREYYAAMDVGKEVSDVLQDEIDQLDYFADKPDVFMMIKVVNGKIMHPFIIYDSAKLESNETLVSRITAAISN